MLLLFKVLLREAKANANATDNENSTPLHAASQEGKLNVVEILVGNILSLYYVLP